MRVRRISNVWVVALWLAVGLSAADVRLLEAVKNGNREVVRALLKARADVNVAEADGTTPLHWAVQSDDVETVRLLTDAGAHVNAANRYGITPLSLAAVNGSAIVIDTLVKAGANPNAMRPEGETVLMTAARTGKADAVRVLLEAGAHVDARESWFGETALMWAAAENHPEATRLLIKHGAAINARSNEVQLPKVKVDAATMVVTALPRGGLTPLMLAARQGALDSARVLSESGADLNLTDPDGTSAMVMAVINGHYDVAALLAERGADPNVADAAGMGALYAAVDMHTQDSMINRPLPKPSGLLDSVALVNVLLEHGANPNLRLKTPLLARQHNAGDASLGEGATPLMRAAKYGDLPMIRLLLDKGADPGLTLKNQTTALMIAVTRAGRNAASEDATIEAIGLCLDRGAGINAVNDSGETALHLAVGRGDSVVRFLAERGATLDLKDTSGRTPLDVALGVPAAAPTGGRGGRAGGRGGRGGPAGAPGPVRESTAALLRQLMEERGIVPAAQEGTLPSTATPQ